MELNSRMFTTIIIVIVSFTGFVSCNTSFYTIIKFSSTWGQYCPLASSFPNSLASYVSTQTRTNILASEIEIKSTASSCGNKELQGKAAEIQVQVMGVYPNNGTVSETRTKLVFTTLKGGTIVGGLKISSAQFMGPAVKQKIFTTTNIILVVAAVLVVYLIGFTCILGTLSEGDSRKSKTPRSLFVVGYGDGGDVSVVEKEEQSKTELTDS